jgi:hypothetical protein
MLHSLVLSTSVSHLNNSLRQRLALQQAAGPRRAPPPPHHTRMGFNLYRLSAHHAQPLLNLRWATLLEWYPGSPQTLARTGPTQTHLDLLPAITWSPQMQTLTLSKKQPIESWKYFPGPTPHADQLLFQTNEASRQHQRTLSSTAEGISRHLFRAISQTLKQQQSKHSADRPI